jgi:outer membrane murein-binding lipoprotein Lpp
MRRFALPGSLIALSLMCTHVTTLASDIDELRQKAKAMREEAMQLAKAGNERESESLLKESQLLMEKAEHISQANKGEKKRKDNPAQEEHVRHLKEHLNELLSRQKRLKQDGAPEPEQQEIRAMIEAKENELRMVRAHQNAKPDIPPAFHPQAEKLEIMARRMHHIRVAAENLKLAEAHDMAHQLMEKAEIMERELHEGKQRLAAEINNSHHKQESLDIVRDLRAELEQLRREVKELRQQVEKR